MVGGMFEPMARALLVITVTPSASMWGITPSAVVDVFTNTESRSRTSFAASRAMASCARSRREAEGDAWLSSVSSASP